LSSVPVTALGINSRSKVSWIKAFAPRVD